MGNTMRFTKSEIRERIQRAMRSVSIVGDEVYYPARWRYGERAGGASTSQPLQRHKRTGAQARLQVAAQRVADDLGVTWYADEELSTQADAVRGIHAAQGAA